MHPERAQVFIELKPDVLCVLPDAASARSAPNSLEVV
jgi:hypothetical protein